MKKNLKKRNTVTHYIRDRYIPIYEAFDKEVNNDKELAQRLRYNPGASITSMAVIQLMYDYLAERKKLPKEFKDAINENGTPNETINTEEKDVQ